MSSPLDSDTSPTDAGPFAALLARVRAGDSEAIGELVRRYEPRVRLAARTLLGPALRPHLDSVDLAQSVHRTLLAGLREEKFDFESPEQLLSLVLTVVRRKVAHHWRKMQRQERLSVSDTSGVDVPSMLTSLASPEENPAQSAAINDAVRKVLTTLGETDRRMIELRLSGYSTAEVAAELGLDARILRARLSRLRQKLRDEGVLTEWL
jgi:RNA polymerase sigma-70 factor (ECF subfamily)